MSDGSSARVATVELVLQLVGEVRQQLVERGGPPPEPLVIGARRRPVWPHGPLTADGGATVAVAACPTPLAARRALAEVGTGGAGGGPSTLVVLTDLPEAELGQDLLARFVRPRLLSLSPWDAVRQRFGVRRLDPAFGDDENAWMADALLAAPTDAVRPGTAVLTVDAALAALAEQVLGTTGLTLERLLVASAAPDFAARVEAADDRTVERVGRALADRLGPAGALVAGAIGRGHGEQALPAGLVARTVAGAVEGSYAQAMVRDLTGVDVPTDAGLAAWARAAEVAYDEVWGVDVRTAQAIELVASQLAVSWQAPRPAASDRLAVGFEARLEVLGGLLDRLVDVLTSPAETVPAETVPAEDLRSAVGAVVGHQRAGVDGPDRHRAERARLAARLARWLHQDDGGGLGPDGPSAPLADLVVAYRGDGAWVDAARRRVAEGDEAPAVFAGALRRLAAAADARRADGNRRFAAALARFTVEGTSEGLAGTEVVAVEAVLDDVVVPLGRRHPMLVVVLDGCGLAPFLELADQFRSYGLAEVGPGGSRRVGLAALPTVTEVSRTSLLCGALRTGAAADEARGLPGHAGVAALDGPEARVFHHHQDLVTGIGHGLPDRVTDALSANGPRVVAAVVNTVDDELARGTFAPAYRIEALGALPRLLRAAVSAGRVVVVTADHGHVLGLGADGKGDARRQGEGGDRWRAADRAPDDDEVLLRGPRVLLGDDAGVLAPWADDLRYSARHGGYHGGATPEECLVPLSVYVPVGVEPPAGWSEVSTLTPAWWDLSGDHGRPSPAEAGPPPAKRRRRAKPEGQTELFEPSAAAGPAPPTAAAPPSPDRWVADLLASETWQLQRGAVGRRARLDEDRAAAALSVLRERGGVASFAAVAQATGLAVGRVAGFLTVLERILNVDGFPVLTVDRSADEARLDEALVRAQFLDGPPA